MIIDAYYGINDFIPLHVMIFIYHSLKKSLKSQNTFNLGLNIMN